MASISSLLAALKHQYPDFVFAPGETFGWLPETHTITYVDGAMGAADLLHELAHALLGHQDFSRDINLLEMERDAWHLARTDLAPRHGAVISSEAVDEALDTYRDWLHARSLCPTCGATGIQSGRAVYRCLACLGNWRVNDARQCALRRHKTTKKPA